MSSPPSPSSVAVFAPAPQLTITIEGGTDDGDDEIHLHAGGQGLWIARLLAELGVPTTLCASFGGEAGAVLQAVVRREPIHEVLAVEVAAVNGAYVHDRRGGERREIAGQAAQALGRHDRDELYTAAVATGLRAGICVLGGYDLSAAPVPPDLYRRLAADLRANGTLVVADLSGALREAATAGGVDVLKTSDEDLADDELLTDRDDERELIGVMHGLADEHGIPHLVVTRAEQPALALTEGELVTVRGPRLEVLDHRGAGDSVTAGITAALSRGAPFRDALRTGIAAGTLNVARHGLATGRAEAIAAVVDHIEVLPLGVGAC
jgi:1-phosphofructokinase